MALLEETYRPIDPDGVLNMAFVDDEFKGSTNFPSKMKTGKNLLDA